MYYLDEKQFKPMIILFSIPFIPCIIGLIIANILLFKIELLIMLSIITIIMRFLRKHWSVYLLVTDLA